MAETSGLIDLHAHTTCSDGYLDPVDLIDRAASNGVTTLAITDHDTIAAYDNGVAEQHAKAQDVRLIPGIEFSATEPDGSRAHILGLGVDIAAPILSETIQLQDSARNLYAADVCKLLEELGWNIDLTALQQSSPVITKAHIARAVLANPANTGRLREEFSATPTAGAFIEEFMIKGRPAYLPVRQQLTARAAVSVIHQAGGAAIFAHPVAHLYESKTPLSELESQIQRSGVDGIEAYYIYYAKNEGDAKVDAVDDMIRIAEKLGLFVTGGSDFHGDNPSIGNFVELGLTGERIKVPEATLDAIAETKQKLQV